MTDFLTSSACRGRRPKSLGIQRQYPRGDLLAKMIRKRNTVRFLVAPPLFGKTMLVAEYADSVFSFENVFWLQAKSPCFLRDLDRKAIAPALLKKGEKPSLAIFEDIPLLDEGRAEALSAVFDELLSQGCEVIATMTPHCDVFREHQPDAVWLKTQEFLLTDTEINARRSDFEQLAHPVASLPISQRIPGIFWGDTKAHEKFCQAIVKEELAIDELLTIFIMLILENGYLSDITNFVKGWDAGLLENLQSDYAYLGIDTYREQFAACSLSLNNIAKAFTPSLDAMAIHSNFGDKSSLVCHLANLLVTGDNPERACGLVLRMCPPYQRASWLEENFEQLFRQGCFLPAHQVFESIKSSNISYGSKLSVIEAWCLAFLGDETRALRGVARLYLALDLDKETRALAALLLIRFGQKSQAKKALALLGNLIEYDSTSAKGYGGQQAIQRIAGQGFLWEILAFGQLCIHHQRAALTDFLEALRSAGAPSQGLGLLLVWLLDDIHLLLEGGASGEEKQQTTACLRYVATYLERRSRANDIGFSDVLLLAKFERVVALTGDADSMALVPRSLVTFAHEMEVSLFGQQNSYQRLRKEAVEKRSEFRRTHPDELRSDATEVTSQTKFAPLLRVRLFGGLEVRVGEKTLDAHLFSRRKVKTLFALLVIHQGKEFPRERLCKMLWPESDVASAQRNLYSVWGQLKRALASEIGNCPYLIHTQFSYKLDANMVTSDVAEFDSLCKKLLFDFEHVEEWSQIFMQLDDVYIDDLLPTEIENPYIVEARRDYRARLADTLSAAALRLMEVGEFQASLCFARAALLRDTTREDSYTTLMKSQIALGQRAAALETYFKCRYCLVEELGIDPSEKTTLLYNSIIAEEPGFKTYELPLALAQQGA